MKFALTLFSLLLFLSNCNNDDDVTTNPNPTPSTAFWTIAGEDINLTKTEMNGVSFENVDFQCGTEHVTPMKEINASWITTMPFGFIRSDSDSVEYNHTWQWYGEKREGVMEIINLCHENDLKVMLKPHIWSMGQWIGDVEYDTEAEWKNFEDSYLTYALDFAEIAESLNVEAFCIGVEMKKIVQQRPDFWPVLIEGVRAVYSGPITYAANWDNYQNVTFWDQLDFIGIDAYFPVSDSQTPTVEECYTGWKDNFEAIRLLSESLDKKVIFTEYGFRNVDFTGKEPWDQNDNGSYNNEAQENAYKATFARFWKEPWFEGGFFWKWHPKDNEVDGSSNNRFTPQNKPVETLISTVFEETN